MNTLCLVMAMRKPDFPAALVGPHRAFLARLRAEGRMDALAASPTAAA